MRLCSRNSFYKMIEVELTDNKGPADPAILIWEGDMRSDQGTSILNGLPKYYLR